MCSTSRISASSSIGGAAGGVLVQQRTYRVGDLPPPAVSDRHVDQQARVVGGGLRRVLQDAGGAAGQQVERAHRVHVPAARRRARDGVLDDPQQRLELSGGRVRLSVDSSQRVTTSTPASRHHSSSSKILSAPFWWPLATSSRPADLAHRRLPSHITPTCRGIASGDRDVRACARKAGRPGHEIPSSDLPVTAAQPYERYPTILSHWQRAGERGSGGQIAAAGTGRGLRRGNPAAVPAGSDARRLRRST